MAAARRPVVVTALACVLAGDAGCARPGGPSAVPDTPVGRTFRAWLDAYNAADSAGLEAYARRYEPAMSVHTQLTFRAQTGPWVVASVERSAPRHLEVVLRSRADSTVGFTPISIYGAVDVDDGTPPGGTPAGGPVPRATRATTRFALLGTGPRAPVPRIGAAERAAAVDSVAAKVLRNYVRPDVARRVADSLRARQARGAYDDATDATEVSFAQRLDRDLRALGGDPQLGVEYAWRVPLPPPVPTPPAWLHCGLDSARVLAGDVGYARLYGFAEPGGPRGWECGHRVSQAIQAVAGARALILDLREAGDEGEGARAGMAYLASYLASYLVAGCTHLGDLWDRRTGRTAALRTHDGLPGPAFGGTKPLVVLTSARTFAAAEEFAYTLQLLGRATVVGERTGGGAHTTAVGPVGAHLLVRVPVARAANPITNTNWEGTGVEPDVRVAAGEALATAQRFLARRLIREGRVAEGRVAEGRVPRAAPAPGVAFAAVPPRLLPGLRFSADTLVPYAAWRGVLSRVAGVVEFAGGRGRFDVTAVIHAPAVALQGVRIGVPLARPGDYYLFDNAGFVLVRPAARTFSSVAFTRADFNHTGALLPGISMFGMDATARPDTPAVGDRGAEQRQRQHAPVTVHWHAQPRQGGRPGNMYARGWLEVADAPAVEAGVARWFEVAAALATRPDGGRALPPDGVEVTSVVLIHEPDGPGARPRTNTRPNGFSEMLAPRGVTATDIDPARLVLPSGYTEAPWPGIGRVLRTPPRPTSARWHTREDASGQRARAACGTAWLPDPPEVRDTPR